MQRIGLALGGGGVRGLSHILVLELLDELNLKPCVIAGTSMGALVGALYASGMSGKSIRELAKARFATKDKGVREAIRRRVGLLKWVGPSVKRLRRGGVFEPDWFLSHLVGAIAKTTFEELEIPLLVVASDFWAAEAIVFDSGELLPAIGASIAVPGVFAPLALGERVLVDGGIVNVVPFDLLEGRCDVSIAVDVGRSRIPGRRAAPNALDALLGAFDIMQAAALARKMETRKPDIFVQPQFGDLRIFDFSRVDEVFKRTEPAIEKLRSDIARLGIIPPAEDQE